MPSLFNHLVEEGLLEKHNQLERWFLALQVLIDLKREEKEKSVKQLTLETKEVGQSEKENESASKKQKWMDARAYRAFFKK